MIRVTVLLLVAASAFAAEFSNGQAARLVIGQPAFSAQEVGISASTLVVSNGHLFATDTRGRVLTFSVTNLPSATAALSGVQRSSCAVCGFSPEEAAAQRAMQSSPAVAVHGKTVIVADAQNRRVFIWRDTSSGDANQTPDVVLGQALPAGSTVSATTLVEPAAVAFDGKRLFVGDTALHRVLIWNSLPLSNNEPADAVLGQPDFTTVNTTDVPGADTVGRPAALASDGGNLFVADLTARRILVFTPGDAALPRNAVVNAASLDAGPFAPGTLITITASGLTANSASAPDDGTQPLPTKLGGIRVMFDGIALPLLSVSPAQIRAQIPFELSNRSAGSMYIRSEHADGSVTITSAAAIRIVPANPGLFAFGGPEPRSGLILHADPTSPEHGGTPVTADNPAKPGEVVILWAAGLGRVSAVAPLATGAPFEGSDAHVLTPVSAVVNGRSAQVVSAGLPHGSIGIYEVRILLPADLVPDPKAQLLITQDNYVSNKITVPVQAEKPLTIP